MKPSKGVGVIHRDLQKGSNGGKIQAMGNSQYLLSSKLRCLVFNIIVLKTNKHILHTHEYWIPYTALDM